MSNYMNIYHLTDEKQTCENVIVEFEGEVITSIFQSYSNPEVHEDLVDKINTIAKYARNCEHIKVEYTSFEEYERMYEDD